MTVGGVMREPTNTRTRQNDLITVERDQPLVVANTDVHPATFLKSAPRFQGLDLRKERKR